MYTIYIPKYQNDIPDFLITKVINHYMNSSMCCNCIISSPGYMSTTSNTINMYLDKLGNKAFGNKKPFIGFFNGMNGKRSLNNGTTTIRAEHESQVAKSHILQSLPIKCQSSCDHRKMMFFINYNGSMPSSLDKTKCSSFLANCTVNGVLVGSSNQSLVTYFGISHNKKNSADKGEADILMYADDSDKLAKELLNLNSENRNRNIRISRSIEEEKSNSETDRLFFKDILRDFLENNLT